VGHMAEEDKAKIEMPNLNKICLQDAMICKKKEKRKDRAASLFVRQ